MSSYVIKFELYFVFPLWWRPIDSRRNVVVIFIIKAVKPKRNRSLFSHCIINIAFTATIVSNILKNYFALSKVKLFYCISKWRVTLIWESLISTLFNFVHVIICPLQVFIRACTFFFILFTYLVLNCTNSRKQKKSIHEDFSQRTPWSDSNPPGKISQFLVPTRKTWEANLTDIYSLMNS